MGRPKKPVEEMQGMEATQNEVKETSKKKTFQEQRIEKIKKQLKKKN